MTYYAVNEDQSSIQSNQVISLDNESTSQNIDPNENNEDRELNNIAVDKSDDAIVLDNSQAMPVLESQDRTKPLAILDSQTNSLDDNLKPQNTTIDKSNAPVVFKDLTQNDQKIIGDDAEVEMVRVENQNILMKGSALLEEISTKEIKDLKWVEEEEATLIEVDREKVFIENVKGLELNALLIARQATAPKGSSNFIKPKVIVRPLMEVGISTQYFLLNALEGIDLDETENGTVFFDGRFINLNLEYARWIGRKWSITTGITYGDILLNLDIDTDFIYDENDFVQDINSEYNDVFDKSNNTNSNDSPVVLSPGVELLTGDVVRLKGSVDLGLRAIQIPFILNYHWYNKRFEFYMGAGFTLESIWARENNIDFNLYDNNILLTEPSTQVDLSEHYFDYSIYGKLGTKININKRLNFDTAISILANDAAFSGLEFGLHYRWHQ